MTSAALRSDWFEAEADALDKDAAAAPAILPRLVAAGYAGAGVAEALGGGGGTISDAVEAIADVSYRSLAAGFVLWGHRTFIEYVLQSTNYGLRDRLLPPLLSGKSAGATGLSNAMKFLSGLEGLQITAAPESDGFRLTGKLPWVTNLRPQGFWVGAAATQSETQAPLVVAIPSDVVGVQRSADLDLMAMRASNTAAIDLSDTWIGRDCVLTYDALSWLPRVRPAFLGMQCGLSIGLARRGLDEARVYVGQGRHVLLAPLEALTNELSRLVAEMHDGLERNAYVVEAGRLFELRIRLAEIAQEAVSLELQASGGKAYLAAPGRGFQRRWREAAFVPIITPSLVQLRGALAARDAERAA